MICNRAVFLREGRIRAAGEPSEVIREFRHQLHGDANIEAAPFGLEGKADLVLFVTDAKAGITDGAVFAFVHVVPYCVFMLSTLLALSTL